MGIKKHHRGGGYGRGDDPHGVTRSLSVNVDGWTTGNRERLDSREREEGIPASATHMEMVDHSQRIGKGHDGKPYTFTSETGLLR